MLPGTVAQRNAVGRVVEPIRVTMGEPDRRRDRGGADDGLEPIGAEHIKGAGQDVQPDFPVVRLQRGPHELAQPGRVHAEPAHVVSVFGERGRVQDLGINGRAIQEPAIKQLTQQVPPGG